MHDRRPLYPALLPYRTGRLKVSTLHEIYYEECGNPAGKPVLMLHGGPGAGISPFMRRGHDPRHYRIILFNQRGSGNSTPSGCLEENTTWDLVADIETLRTHLGIERWQLVGGSWGATLALTYAVLHPSRVTDMILRAITTGRECEVDWFYEEGGANFLFPEAYAAYQSPIAPQDRHAMIAAYHRLLSGPAGPQRDAAARAWIQWGSDTSSLLPVKRPSAKAVLNGGDYALAFARIENHYFHHKSFFPQDGWLLARADRLRGIPATLIQGRYDICTPAKGAHDLAVAWPDAKLVLVQDAGHRGTEPGIVDALVRATESHFPIGG